MPTIVSPFHGKLYERHVKRATDILFSLILLIIFFPVYIVVCIAIKFDSKGPLFADVPERIGQGRKKFKMLKFRSMIVNAHKLLRDDPSFRELYEEYKRGSYKLRQDPRITRVGRFIRKHSLDEIPQLINVLQGDMSLVGPRAYYPDELEEQQKNYPQTKELVKKVVSVKPGITGLWQVSGRSNINFDKRIALDAAYVDTLSLWNDIRIILTTPFVMISGKGAI